MCNTETIYLSRGYNRRDEIKNFRKMYCLAKLAILTVGLFLIDHSEACSQPVGWKPPTLIEKVGWHPRLILGRVIRQIPEWRFGGKSYTAEVEVECILRGDRTPVLINVTEAGFQPGRCYGTSLEEGKRYIIGLRADDRASAPSISEEHIDEALEACNLNPPTYPYGNSESRVKYVCPAGLPEGLCREQ